ncbi:TonB-dependent receptor [Chitiniphilus purpureus]|uniref:TonB-dependent receptor n=1 Tax=Chitiniphilus purpureus TaxID=2981137 RepID=A0ABY6DHS9_9NEIS|nr:TonB-dependent receptor [Chitiniphilus sp. CD1]UXY13905.1 TonB-dependent receptor [Chitiniphilus sp. CD1]
MSYRLIPILPLALTSLAVHADAEPRLPDVVVTAARLPQAEREVIGDVTVIERQQIAAYPGGALPDLLQSVAGVQLASNGGPGKITSLFVRGAESAQTLVLIDGVRYGSATAGAAAIQFLPLEQIERVEILRGPAASLYGADAIGGVVQIFTRQGRAGLHPSASVGIGTEGTRTASAGLAGGSEATRVALGVAHNRTDGVSALAAPANAPFNEDEDGYENSSVSLSFNHRFDTRHELGGSVLAARVKSQYDNAYTASRYDYRTQGTNGAATLWSRNRLAAGWLSTVQAGISMDDSDNYGPRSAVDPGDAISRFKTQQEQFSWLNALDAGPGVLTLGIETLRQRITSTTPYDMTQRRINSAQGGYLAQLGAFSAQLNVRSDDNSQFGRSNNGSLGLSWRFTPAWQLGGAYATGFRAPTFNELYYPGFGNPLLKPERSRNAEAFLRYAADGLQAGVTAYRNRVTDLLQYNAATYSTDNIGKATLRGVTVTADWRGDGLLAGGSLDWLDARDTSGGRADGKQLARRAPRAASAYVGMQQGAWQARAEVQAQGKRYDDAANTLPLGGYALAHLSMTWQVARDWQLLARVNNLFDKEYQQAKGYGTLGRNALVELRWQQ